MPERPGRPRDAEIDASLLAAAVHQLAIHGYEGLSLARVAAAAGTTRQALYRRHASKADLVTAAIASLRRPEERLPTDDPKADLIAELEAFRRGVSRPDGTSMIGTMLQGGADPELVSLFRTRLVEPRRAALRTIFERAHDAGAVGAPAQDLELVITMLTGSWYAYALAGVEPPDDWPARIATLAWRSLAPNAG